MDLSFEQGPIRPPSEARSLLIRATRNCPWNKCAFCHTYRGTKFSLRDPAEIKEDIRKAGRIADELKELSWRYGEGGQITGRVVNHIYGQRAIYNDGFRSVAAWLYFGGESVFLQDANSLIMKTDVLIDILTFIRERFPEVKRITTYGRSHTAARKSVDELVSLHKAGLSRIHSGLESGCDAVLDFMRKGATAADHIKGGQRIVEAGISLCEYVMPGLGGIRWTKEHADDTARVINAIDPDFVRLRSLHVVRGTELYEMMQRGEFEPLGDEAILREIRQFIERLDGIGTTLVSDHILNLLEELEGRPSEDKPKLLATIDRYFSLPEQERIIYRLGRRMGLFRRLDDLSNQETYLKLKGIVDRYAGEEPGRMERDLAEAMQNYI
ncbi:MAG: radical SAM protein [Deltaproteobacteria bacterium]|nr:radical SAM protein [Deltaproteobacteria bacterium]